MGGTADYATAEIGQALQFASSLLDGANIAYYEIEGKEARRYTLHDVSPDFHKHYISGMRDCDPLGVARIYDRHESIFSFEYTPAGSKAHDTEKYVAFLRSFNVEETLEIIFRRDGIPFAGMGLNWCDNKNRSCSLRSPLTAAQAYLEFNLGRSSSPAIAEKTSRLLNSLTLRERQVAELLCCGRTNSEIALALDISNATVKTHLLHIFDKIGADNRTCAVALLTRDA